MKNLKYYFVEGFSLANKNIYLFIILVILNVISTIALKQNLLIRNLSIIIGLVVVAYQSSIPFFLFKNYKKEKLEIKEITRTTLKNFKRLIVSFVVVFVFIVILIFLLAIIEIVTKTNVFTFLSSPTGTIFFVLLFSPLYFIIPFANILFSIEGKSVWQSIKESYKLSLKNHKIVLISVFVLIITNLILDLSIQITTKSPIYLSVLKLTLSSYVNFISISALLIYYLEVIRDNNAHILK